MLKRIGKTIVTHSLLSQGDHVLVAVSGGADSVALLRVLILLSSTYNLNLTAAHLNHGLRGCEADRDEVFVRHLCEQMGIPCICKRADRHILRSGRGRSLEEVCRAERYRFLYETADGCRAGKIATGHHRDDQAETVLMNMIRGTGMEGMKGIVPFRDGRIIRPLLTVTKQEIRQFLDREGLASMEDSSNLNRRFLRNRIRNDLLPTLKERYNPRIVEGICNMAEVIRREDDYLQTSIRKILDQWGIVLGTDAVCISIAQLCSLHDALQGRIVKHLLETVSEPGTAVGYRHIEAVLAHTKPELRRHVSLDLPGGIRVKRGGGDLYIIREDPSSGRRGRGDRDAPPPAFSYPVVIPGTVCLKEQGTEIRFDLIEKPTLPVMKERPGVAFLDIDRIDFPLIVRSQKGGDWIDPLGMGGRKRLKTYFIDRKIPRPNRGMIPLLVDGRSVIWIAGERISDRVKVTGDTKKVLKAEMI